MASSRMDKIGTIFTRVTGLMKSGAMKPEDRPIWYDIYRAFPPKLEPRVDRQTPAVKLRPLLYKEDLVRANFHKRFGAKGQSNMLQPSSPPSLSQRVVLTALDLKKTVPELKSASEEELVDAAVQKLKESGVSFERRTRRQDEEGE
ncbi:unnamed protein product, partial [Cyprideis torosa]